MIAVFFELHSRDGEDSALFFVEDLRKESINEAKANETFAVSI